MTQRFPPRYLPTLTEVVNPAPLGAGTSPAQAIEPATAFPNYSMPMPAAPLDKNALARQILQQVRPRLEAELRSIALELFEAQFSALLPSLQLQIEETVRDAIDQAIPDQADTDI
jgi:hypothetical protein